VQEKKYYIAELVEVDLFIEEPLREVQTERVRAQL
jgi:hypothetical protein